MAQRTHLSSVTSAGLTQCGLPTAGAVLGASVQIDSDGQSVGCKICDQSGATVPLPCTFCLIEYLSLIALSNGEQPPMNHASC
jgi:hypothetical protein